MFKGLDGVKNHIFGLNAFYTKAPGRINLIGEHTDYNGGFVFPASIDRYMYFGFILNDSNTINITALDVDEEVTIEVGKYQSTDKLWANYLIGILREFVFGDIQLKGFDCAFSSEIPIGSGLSSSAALDCGFMMGVNSLMQANLSKWDMVGMSNRSNNNFLEVKSGILDQFASLFGAKDKAMFLDCSSNKYDYISVSAERYSWLLINTCVKHNHTISGYNNRAEECELALTKIQVTHPHVLSISDLKAIEELEHIELCDDTLKNRVTYIIEENQRVLQFKDALECVDWTECGRLLYQSHEGLQHKYAVSCPELDFLVDALRNNTDVIGSRMMGGGFGGCTLNLIESTAVDSIKEIVFTEYQAEFGIEPEFYEVNLSDGASLL